jgi:hypothetical protein
MPKQIGSLAPATVSVALFVALIAIIQATAPAQAAADCVPAPGLQAAQGSHWYYRTDRATGRKCWYVSSDGRKGHGQIAPNLTTRAQPPEESPASFASETVGDPLTPSTPIEQPATPTWPAGAGDTIQAAAPTPEPVNAGKPKQAERVPAAQEQATADANVTDAQPEATAQQPIAATAEMTALVGITPVSMLLLLIGVLALAGILLRRISETAVTRPLPSRPFQNDLAVVIAAARRAAPPLPPPYSPRDYAGAHASAKEESNSLRAKPRPRIEDVEEALLGVLQHWERPTASANKSA